MTTTLTVPLYRAAHGRTGDKGNRSNISVIAWHPRLWDTLVEQITADVVQRAFAHRRPSAVTRCRMRCSAAAIRIMVLNRL